MANFTEPALEQSIMTLFEQQQYTHLDGETIERDTREVLLKADLRHFLQKKYRKDGITEGEIDRIILKLEMVGGGLYEANRSVMKWVMNGFSLRRDDLTKPNLYVYLVDFDDPLANDFKIVNQFEIQGETNRRPDAIIFINGIPLVLFEFKSAIREDATIYNAYEQITVRYRRDIPDIFKYNAFVVISDGVNSKFGSLFTPYEFFYAWRKVEQSDKSVDGINSLLTMIEGLFRRDRIVEVIHDYIFFPDTTIKENKIVCRYPQFFAAQALYKSVINHSHLNPDGDGKGGTYFGATGCGKSYTMLFLCRLLMKSKQLSSPTILLITDRTDLDDQLSGQLLTATDFIGDSMIKQVESRAQLGEYLQGRTSGGVFLTTIQKFTEDTGLLSDRTNIICISDEAHRSQTGLQQELTITDKGVKRHYGFAKYLRDSLPGATYVGFTGTPIDATIEVFGPIVDKYTMAEAVADEITRRIVYEGRASKVIIESDVVKQIEAYYSKCAEEGASEYQIEESKRAMASMEVLLSDEKLLKRIAEDFVWHYEKRVEEGSTVVGKAMFVCPSRKIAWQLYKDIIEIRPDWGTKRINVNPEELTSEERRTIKPIEMVKMVITRDKDDPAELYNMLGTDEYRKDLADQYKEVRSNFKIAIVVDMWITGFDVPSLDTMYVFKPLQKHTLIQTISRVNRVYPGKEKGLVVDYLGIKNNMNKALRQYGTGGDDNPPIDTTDTSLRVLRDELDILRRFFHGFDYSAFTTGTPLEQLECLNRAADFVIKTKESETFFMLHSKKMNDAYNLCSCSDKITKEEHDDIQFFRAVRSVVYKLTKGEAPDAAQMNLKVSQMIKEAFLSQEVEEITKIGVEDRFEIDVLSEQYLERLKRIPYQNTKLKLIERLLRQVIDNLKKVNKMKGIDFTKRLDEIVRQYNDRSDNSTIASEVIDDVVSQMESLLHEVNSEKDAAEKMGISYEEKAFYDILKAVRDKYGFPYEEDRLIDLAKQIKLIIDDKSRYVDWATRTDRKAELKMDIVITLARNKYPPFTKDEVFKEILEQAENFKKNRLVDGYQIREPEYHMVAEPEGPKYGTRLNINDE